MNSRPLLAAIPGKSAFRVALFATTIFCSTPLLAQTEAQPFLPGAAPAATATVDENGVNLVSGTIGATWNAVSVGPADGTGLSYSANTDGTSLRDNIEGAIYGGLTRYVVYAQGESFEFTKTSPTTFTEVVGNGHSLSYDGTEYYTFRKNDGTVYRFSHLNNLAPNGEGPDGYDLGALTDVVLPTGETKTYTYRREVKPILNGRDQVGTAAFRRVQSG